MTELAKPVESPCVSVCYLDDGDICAGCYRSAGEITQWTSYSNSEKTEVLTLCHQRRHESGFSF